MTVRKSPHQVPTEVIVEAYLRHKDVWRAGKELGINGQAVHRAIRNAGLPPRPPAFTERQRALVVDYYTKTAPEDFDLDFLAASVGKSKTIVCGLAKKLGLTNKSRPANLATNAKAKRPKWQDKPHPRGFLGGKHSEEAIIKLSEASKRAWATAKLTNTGSISPENLAAASARMSIRARAMDPTKAHTRAKGGYRADLGGKYFRSSWEANYARYLNLLMKMKIVESWEFEPETFWFEKIRRGVRSYLPDFRVKYRNDPIPEYVEVKGWIMPKDRTKWSRLKKYHPHTKHVVVGAKEYRSIKEKWSSAIPEWEFPSRKVSAKPKT